MPPFLLTRDIVLVELNTCNYLTLLVCFSGKKACRVSLLTICKLFYFHLILMGFVWWEGHLSFIQLIKHGRWFDSLTIADLKAHLIDCILVNPRVTRILYISRLVKLSGLLVLILELLVCVISLCLLKRTAFSGHLRSEIAALWAIHFSCFLENELFRRQFVRMFHVDFASCSFVLRFERVSSCGSVIDLRCLRTRHQVVLISCVVNPRHHLQGLGARSS